MPAPVRISSPLLLYYNMVTAIVSGLPLEYIWICTSPHALMTLITYIYHSPPPSSPLTSYVTSLGSPKFTYLLTGKYKMCFSNINFVPLTWTQLTPTSSIFINKMGIMIKFSKSSRKDGDRSNAMLPSQPTTRGWAHADPRDAPSSHALPGLPPPQSSFSLSSSKYGPRTSS